MMNYTSTAPVASTLLSTPNEYAIAAASTTRNGATTNATGFSNLACAAGTTEITGLVYEDFDYDGLYDSGDIQGLENISITVTDSLGNSFSATTDNTGAYTIPGLIAGRTYRVDFTNLPAWAQSTFFADDNGTTVQFMTAGNYANLSLSSPGSYCQINPTIGLSCFQNGTGLGNPTDPGFVSFPWTNTGNVQSGATAPTYGVPYANLGTTWGFANNTLTHNGTDYELTAANNATGANADAIDSDGTIAAGIDPDFDGEPYLQITTGSAGQVNHTYDFGFMPPGSTSGCECTEYVYLNETSSGGAVHKYTANPDGSLSEIGSPWYDNNESIDKPHGLAIDLNGNVYIGESDQGDIRKFDCDGNLTPAGDYEIAVDGIWNMGSVGNTLFANNRSRGSNPEGIYAYDLCTTENIGYICLNQIDKDYRDWGFYIDENNMAYISQGYGGATNHLWIIDLNVVTLNNLNEASPVCYDPIISENTSNTSPSIGDTDLSTGQFFGVTTDDNGNIYMVRRLEVNKTSQLIKYSLNGSGIYEVTAVSLLDSAEGSAFPGTNPATGMAYTTDDRGFYSAIGIIYSTDNQHLYVSTASPTDDCVALFNTDLEYLGAAVPFTNNTSVAKGIGITKQCCPTSNNLIVDTTLCVVSTGDLLFLSEFIQCEGAVCEGIWQQDPFTSGLTFNPCGNTVTIDEIDACGTYTLTSDGTGTYAQCGIFTITVNIEVISLQTVTLIPDSTICAGESILLYGELDASGSPTYQWEQSTTSCTADFTPIIGATDSTYLATPTGITYYRLLTNSVGTCASGNCADTSACVTIYPADLPVATVADVLKCTDNSETISVVPSGGTGPYTYSWSGPYDLSGETEASFITSVPGTYTVTVTDDNDCTVTTSGEMTFQSKVCLPFTFKIRRGARSN